MKQSARREGRKGIIAAGVCACTCAPRVFGCYALYFVVIGQQQPWRALFLVVP